MLKSGAGYSEGKGTVVNPGTGYSEGNGAIVKPGTKYSEVGESGSRCSKCGRRPLKGRKRTP